MKILQLCKKFPFPLKDGESIAINALSRSLHALGCELTLLAMNTSKHRYNETEFPEALDHYQEICMVDIDNRIKFTEAFFHLFSNNSYQISRFVSDHFKHKLISLLQRESFDLIQLETLYLAPYIPAIRQYTDAPIAMRAHNVEHKIWERIHANAKLGPRKWYLRHLAQRLKQYEIQQLNAYDLMVAISEKDLSEFQAFGFAKPGIVTPIGTDIDHYLPEYRVFKKEISLSFIGSLDWMPNQEGLVWFLDNIWGKLHRKFPNLELHVAGRNTPDWLMQLNKKNVHIHGEVPDSADFINRHSVMIVPLLSGSGMRAKIIEGMALGKVVITTSLGLEGINAQHRSEVLVADTPEEFIRSIAYCYRKGPELEKMGRKAQEFVARNYDSLEIARKLLKIYQDLLIPAV
ncbi:MAG: glycosyltransferase [Lewinellaceae bacterium]|nr:glycosyltransferase [Lewinella sp.]MCB9281175.1 glycosyltransferase [Lewinellaceae bacterium]